jgi:hypothetical protein
MSCSKIKSRKVERPNKEELHKLVWSKPAKQVAKDYGVSDHSIAKWCKDYGIDKPSKGYWQKILQGKNKS